MMKLLALVLPVITAGPQIVPSHEINDGNASATSAMYAKIGEAVLDVRWEGPASVGAHATAI